MSQLTTRVRIPDFHRKKKLGQKITMLTAYDATMARLLDRAGVDALLVGDSLGMVILGHETTIPVTLDAMIHHARAVSRGAERAFVVADMPFLTWQASSADAIRNAGGLMQEGGVSAVKIEGGLYAADTVRRLTDIGIPVMAHIGLVPQAIHQLGGYRVAGRTQEQADRLVEDAHTLEQAGAFAIVLECIPVEVAAAITAKLAIPTIGIGAGPHCDGQVLVSYDAFGLYDGLAPKFVKKYANLGDEMIAAAKQYIAEVERGEFPDAEHSFRFPASTAGSRSNE
jgi:3-methyl-2-oxobutanoate hydroxymethyltransferase